MAELFSYPRHADREARGTIVQNRRHLYHARINRRLTLEQIGLRTALSPSVLRHLDEGRFELLPSGVYARSYVRTFAAAVGLDPEAALAELESLLPGAPDPIPALNAAAGPTPIEQLRARLEPIVHAAADAVARGRRQIRATAPLLERLRTPPLTHCAAVAIDALVLLGVDTLVLALVSFSSGLSIRTLVETSAPVLLTLGVVPVALYFVLFGGIAGTTVGRWFCQVVAPSPHHPLTLPEILKRATFQ